MGWRVWLAFFLSWLASTVAATIFDLAQLDWTLKNQNGSIQIPASGPPSHVHLDLARAGVITEPLLGINDFTERWVADDNWTYTADLTPFSTNFGGKKEAASTLLVFYGIDTVANISLRGQPVAWVNNQFRQWTFDVSDHFTSHPTTDNNLTIVLESAYHYALNVSKLPDAETFPGNGGFEYPGIWPWIRKVADDFGWDWGPAFVPTGIYKPAYLVTLSSDKRHVETEFQTEQASLPLAVEPESIPGSVFVEETSIDIFKRGQSFSNQHPDQTADWIVNVTLAIRTPVAIPKAVLSISFPELQLVSQFDILNIPVSTKTPHWISAIGSIPEGIPQRWYPHDLGTGPKLYDIIISLNDDRNSGNLFHTVTRTGFRTIVIAQTPYSDVEIHERGITPGDQWHFEINGKPFYAKGTNLIPFDPFYPRIPTDRVRWILESAVKSGQNMLRVWGGGAYQPSSASEAGGVYDFYSICDELGILAWSELIFSDALYPINDFLLETIEPEVRQNVRRVNRHPSNAQWAGGNEIEGIVIWTRNWENNGIHYFNEYVELFQKFLYNAVTSETKSVPYTDCSTTHGVLSLDPYVLRFENGTSGYIYGNSERFNYDASVAFDYSTYPVARFVNEFGFHSMPSFYSWEEVLPSPDDFSFNSTVVQSRTHHPPASNFSWPNPNAPQGHAEMTKAVEMWLPTPGDSADTNQTFAQWCYSTQVFQAMTMVSQVAWYRHGAGKGENNLGALIWQLNDIWQGVSWSTIEYSGRWKVLNYGLAGIYSPVVIYPFWTPSNQSLQVLTISDRWEEVKGTAQLTWFDWAGRPLNVTTVDFATPSLNNSVILEASGLTNILPVGRDPKDVWMLLNLTAEINGGKVVHNEQYFTPTSLADAHLVDPKIEVTRGEGYRFTLSAKGGVAPWTWMDHPAGTVGVFVDDESGLPTNGFYLIPGADRTLRFELTEAISTVKNPDPADFVVRSVWSAKTVQPRRRPGLLRCVAQWVLGIVFFGTVGGHIVRTRAKAEESAKAQEQAPLLDDEEPDRHGYGATATTVGA